jgi:HD-like signal output (HDOD) protein/CheY-like chemotaxis protein
MNIMFVDDEPNVLEGLERALMTRAPDDWNVVCIESGAAALTALERGPFDIVVSDMRMPGMDGAELLHRIAERWPTIARIVLSGHTDEAAALRAAAVAHQFLAKPCEVGQLMAVLEHLAQLNRSVDGPVRALVGGLNRLPPLPAVYRQLRDVLADGRADSRAIAEIVRKDPAISVKLLQLVNSAYFCRGNRITDLATAVTRLGTRTVRSVALSEAIIGDTAPPTRFHLRELSERCLHASLVVERLAAIAYREDATLAALLSNVGLHVVAHAAPTQLDAALARARVDKTPLVVAERLTYGTTHAEVGGYLLGLWGLPGAVASAVTTHHEHELTGPEDSAINAAVHVAAHHAEGEAILDDVLAAAKWSHADVTAALTAVGEKG